MSYQMSVNRYVFTLANLTIIRVGNPITRIPNSVLRALLNL